MCSSRAEGGNGKEGGRGPREGPGMLFAPLPLRGLLFAAPANEPCPVVPYITVYGTLRSQSV